MKLDQVRSALRMVAMFLLGIVPAILLILFLLLVLVFAGPVLHVLGGWLTVMIALAILGVIGLWGATFQNEEERVFPTGVTIALLFCGLLGAGPILIEMPPTALEVNGLSMWLTVLLLGPVACAVYFLLERVIVRLSKRVRASKQPGERRVQSHARLRLNV